MRAVITGNLGFLGRHFQRRLKAEDWTVFGFDIRGMPKLDALDFFLHDNYHYDLAIHCAATIPDLEERHRNAMPMVTNMMLDNAYFLWAMRTRPTGMVYLSSVAAYPIKLNQEGYSLGETDIRLEDMEQPDGMYGLSKLMAEYAAAEAQRQGQPVLVVRPQTGYGEDQAKTYPFRAIIERAKRREDPLVVWGSGDQARDFIHVDDVVDAVLTMHREHAVGPVNIGTGIPTTLHRFAEMVVEQVPDYDPEIVCDKSKPEGSPFRYADVQRMHAWYDHKVTLEEGIERALEYQP